MFYVWNVAEMVLNTTLSINQSNVISDVLIHNNHNCLTFVLNVKFKKDFIAEYGFLGENTS